MVVVCIVPYSLGSLSLSLYLCLSVPFMVLCVFISAIDGFVHHYSIMEGEQSLKNFSPEEVVQDPSVRHAVSLLPYIILLHGTADYSIPSDARCIIFCKELLICMVAAVKIRNGLEYLFELLKLIPA